jgi:hypothetical protein
MNQKIKLVLAGILTVVCVYYAAVTISNKRNASAQMERQIAVMHELNDSLRVALRDYYAANEDYPDKLAALDAELLGGSDTKARIVKDFIYTAGPKYYILTWGLQWDNEPMQTHKEQAMKGEVKYVESYVDDVLQTRIEYPDGYANPDSRVEKAYLNGDMRSVITYRNGEVVDE